MQTTTLLKKLSKKKFGPFPSFLPLDIIRVMWLLEKRTGRARLAREVGLGELSTRTILKFLSENGLAEGAPMGYKLTAEGLGYLQNVKCNVVAIRQFPASLLTMNKRGVGAQIRAGRNVKNIINLRDEAVRAGAYGATMIEFRNGNFYFMDSTRKVPSEYDKVLNRIESAFGLLDGDKVILCYGGDKKSNERALWNLLLKVI